MRRLTKALVCPSAANVTLEVYSQIGKTIRRIFPAATLTFMLAAAAVSANAATFNVTNTADSGAGSLRQAVLDANSNAGADTINISINAPATIILSTGPVTPNGTLTINGHPLHSTTIHGNLNSRVIDAAAGSSLTLNYLNITRGVVNLGQGLSDGGGIRSLGVLVLNNCAVYENTATNGTGGGIWATTLHMLNSTVSGNTSTISGGGIELESNQPSTIADSTIANNTSGTGGGVHNAQAQVAVRNTIIAGNTATVQRPDWSLGMVSQGYNLIGNTAGTNISGNTTGNQLNVSPGLLPLAFNNGPTKTHSFPQTSIVMEHGDPSRAGMIDQRGAIRGLDGGGSPERGVDMGAYEKQKTLFDFTGDEKADVTMIRTQGTMVRPDSVKSGSPEGIDPLMYWFFQLSPSTMTSAQFGLNTDKPVPADYDGDGKTDIAIYRPSTGTWYISSTSQGFYTIRWGNPTDIPVPGDYDVDGSADAAVYRDGVWHVLGSSVGYFLRNVGTVGDKPVPAFYDEDDYLDAAVFNTGVWTIGKTIGLGSLVTYNFGTAGDIAVPGDYDADGEANLAVFRPSNGTWYIADPAVQSYTATPFGLNTDKPVPADYDGDGKIDIAVFRPLTGQWHINASRSGYFIAQFGFSSDRPAEHVYIQ